MKPPKQQIETEQVEDRLRTNPLTSAFFGRITKGTDSGEIVRLLCFIVLCDDDDNKQPTVTNKTAALEEAMGTTIDTLENFPERVEGWAKEVRQFLGRVFDASDNEVPWDLPDTLVLFAHKARERVHNFRSRIGVDLRAARYTADANLNDLIRFIEGITRSAHYAAVCDLLTETACALGIDASYDTDAIKMRVFRYRKPKRRSHGPKRK